MWLDRFGGGIDGAGVLLGCRGGAEAVGEFYGGHGKPVRQRHAGVWRGGNPDVAGAAGFGASALGASALGASGGIIDLAGSAFGATGGMIDLEGSAALGASALGASGLFV